MKGAVKLAQRDEALSARVEGEANLRERIAKALVAEGQPGGEAMTYSTFAARYAIDLAFRLRNGLFPPPEKS